MGGGGGGATGRHLYRGDNFARKCISTSTIGVPIYIWPQAAIPPAPPLVEFLVKIVISSFSLLIKLITEER